MIDQKIPEVKCTNPDSVTFPSLFLNFPHAVRPRSPTKIRAFLLTILFLATEYLLFYLTSLVRGVDTSKCILMSFQHFAESELFRRFFRRGNSYNTTVLPLSTFLFYMGSNVLGIVYVNFSNLNNYRGNVLVNKYASYSSLIWILALTPVFYFASMMIVLRHP